MQLGYGAHSIIGTNHRLNQDSFRLLGNRVPLVAQAGRGQLFGVFDGMGSRPRGGQSAQLMSNQLLRFFEDAECPAEAAAITRLLFECNQEINRWGQPPDSSPDKGGCAGTVAWFHNDRVTTFQAGDTMALLLLNGQLQPLTSDHSIGDGLLRYFGEGQGLFIEARDYQLEGGEVIILASDGIIKGLNIQEIANCAGKSYLRSPEFAAQELCRLARILGSQDDITTVVIEVEDLED